MIIRMRVCNTRILSLFTAMVFICLVLLGCGFNSQSSGGTSGQKEKGKRSTSFDFQQNASSSDKGSQCAKVDVQEGKDGSRIINGFLGDIQFYQLTFARDGGGIEEQGMPYVSVDSDTIFHAGKPKRLAYAYLDFPEFEESMFFYVRNEAGEMTEPIPLQHRGCQFTTILTFPRVEKVIWGLRFDYRPASNVHWQRIDADFVTEVMD